MNIVSSIQDTIFNEKYVFNWYLVIFFGILPYLTDNLDFNSSDKWGEHEVCQGDFGVEQAEIQ